MPIAKKQTPIWKVAQSLVDQHPGHEFLIEHLCQMLQEAAEAAGLSEDELNQLLVDDAEGMATLH